MSSSGMYKLKKYHSNHNKARYQKGIKIIGLTDKKNIAVRIHVHTIVE